jgi:hypothetical protein
MTPRRDGVQSSDEWGRQRCWRECSTKACCSLLPGAGRGCGRFSRREPWQSLRSRNARKGFLRHGAGLYLPLASLFRVRVHYLTGALLCLLAIVTLLLVPARVTVGNREIIAWWSIVGFGAALILWGTGWGLWLQGLGLLRVALNG